MIVSAKNMSNIIHKFCQSHPVPLTENTSKKAEETGMSYMLAVW